MVQLLVTIQGLPRQKRVPLFLYNPAVQVTSFS